MSLTFALQKLDSSAKNLFVLFMHVGVWTPRNAEYRKSFDDINKLQVVER